MSKLQRIISTDFEDYSNSWQRTDFQFSTECLRFNKLSHIVIFISVYYPVLHSGLIFLQLLAMLVDNLTAKSISENCPWPQRDALTRSAPSRAQPISYGWSIKNKLKPLFLDSTPELCVGLTEAPSLAASHQFSFFLCPILPPSSPTNATSKSILQ